MKISLVYSCGWNTKYKSKHPSTNVFIRWGDNLISLCTMMPGLYEGNPPVTVVFSWQRVNNTGLSLWWRHNGRYSVSTHQPHDCLLKRFFRLRSKKTSKFCVTGLCAGNSPGTGEFPAQMASNAENVSIWWRHHVDISFVVSYWTNNRVARDSISHNAHVASL